MFKGFKHIPHPPQQPETPRDKPISSKRAKTTLMNIPQSSRLADTIGVALAAMSYHKAASLATLLKKAIVIDSGASYSMFSDEEGFSDLRMASCPATKGIGGTIIQPTKRGNYTYKNLIDGEIHTTTIKDAVYCPEIGVNLLSVSYLISKGAEVLFRSDGAYASLGNEIIMRGTQYNGLYLVDQPHITTAALAAADLYSVALPAYSISDPALTYWHERLGHVSESTLRKLVKNGSIKPVKPSCVCEHCVRTKMKETPHLSKLKRGTYKMESLHADIAGIPQHAPKGYDGTTCFAVI